MDMTIEKGEIMEGEMKQAFTSLETLIKNNHKNVCDKLAEVKEDVDNLYERDRETLKELTEVKAQAESTQKELNEFKNAEKEYGKKVDSQLQGLKNMHWKVLGVGIALVTVFIAAYKLIILGV